MNPKEQKVLTATLQANRRALSLLDKRIDDLVKTNPSLLEFYDVDDKQPFFYCAVGVDGQSGIPISTNVAVPSSLNRGENPAFGYIRTHPDSAFVLTSVAACLTRGFLGSAEKTINTSVNGIGFRFYDESSSRWISFTNQNNQPQQKATFPSEAFSPLPALNEGGFLLSAECVFPRSAVIRVEAYEESSLGQFLLNTSLRVQVVFFGYKVYGG